MIGWTIVGFLAGIACTLALVLLDKRGKRIKEKDVVVEWLPGDTLEAWTGTTGNGIAIRYMRTKGRWSDERHESEFVFAARSGWRGEWLCEDLAVHLDSWTQKILDTHWTRVRWFCKVEDRVDAETEK